MTTTTSKKVKTLKAISEDLLDKRQEIVFRYFQGKHHKYKTISLLLKETYQDSEGRIEPTDAEERLFANDYKENSLLIQIKTKIKI